MAGKARDEEVKMSSGRYSASDQADRPDRGGPRRGKSVAAAKPWRGHPKTGEGDRGYRRDQGADGPPVEGRGRR